MAELDRRKFLGLSAGGTLAAIAAGTVGTAAKAAAADTRTDFPAIVIGSGFGGAVSALRLGQAGIDTLILERGKQWQTSPTAQVFGNTSDVSNKNFWFKWVADYPAIAPVPMIPGPGVMENDAQSGINIAAGAAVGGGSIVYTACSVRPLQKYWERIYPSAVTYAEFTQKWWPMVQQNLSTSVIPTDIYNTAPFTHSRIFDTQMAKAGLATTPVESAFNWDIVRKELAGTVRPSAIAGESDFGNSDGAKHDLTTNYLPAALATGHVTLRPLNEVTAIGRSAAGKYTVNVKQLDANGITTGNVQLTCDKLFLSAGSLNTTKLLVVARDSGALPNLNSAVGTQWGDNGDQYNFRSHSDPAGPSQAMPCASTTFIDSGYEVPVRIENWGLGQLHSSPVIMQFQVTADTDHRATWKYDASQKKATLTWPEANSSPARDTGRDINQKVLEANGGSIFNVAWPFEFTAHPLGGAPMGAATDLYGRVKGYTGLYAIDGSIIPGNIGGANPSITIAAFAERNIANIIANAG